MDLTFKVINFGCPVNQYESKALGSAMIKAGFVEAVNQIAHIYIVNSCVVTGSAAAEARRVLRKAKKDNPKAVTVIAGCYPQVYHSELKKQLPEADIIIGTRGRNLLPKIIKERIEQDREGQENLVQKHDGNEIFEEMPVEFDYGRTRPVIKIQEGCDEFCTYCIVARARGKPRSLGPEKVLKQVKLFIDSGYREIILAGNHLGIYGREISGWDLAKIIREIDNLPGHFRVRLSYIEPMDVGEDFLQTIASSKRICPHLYLPLQSGSDRVLKRMGRRYTVAEFSNAVTKARELLPDISIFTDIIAGFPGETEEDHDMTKDLVSRLKLSRLHVFPYSSRHGTAAARFIDQVKPDIIKRRAHELRYLDKQLATSFHSEMVGKELDVLFERQVEFNNLNMLEGFSENYVKVRVPTNQKNSLSSGEIFKVRAKEAFYWGVIADEVVCKIGRKE